MYEKILVTPANNNILSNCLNSLEQQVNNGGILNLITLPPKLLKAVNAFLTCKIVKPGICGTQKI
jgi:hypothetical protein